MKKIAEKKSLLSVIWHWLDENILFILAAFLTIFIPLYPKIPLADLIPGYIVRLRLEDIFVGLSLIIWGLAILRRKANWQTPLNKWIFAYAVVGVLSILGGVFVIGTIPLQLLHIGKSTLHYFRYLEYFFLSFLIFSVANSAKRIKLMLLIFAITLLGVTVYGFGQKYFYWPVYSTMNREFSKGLRLYLTEHARVQSTFGGHYDLAAYLVIVLPILFCLMLFTKNTWLKRGLFVTHYFGLWLLIVTASRTSFLAYLASIGVVVIIAALAKPTWREKITYSIREMFLFGLVTGLIMAFFGGDMTERIAQVLDSNPTFHLAYNEGNRIRKESILWIEVTTGLKKIEPPKDGMSLAEAQSKGIVASSSEDAPPLDPVLVPSDTRPVTSKPSDVYVDVPDRVIVATVSATGETTTTIVERDRTWSDNAIKYGLSLAIRLDTLWPQAIKGFLKNPFTGSGYGTLNKESTEQFTEAESTDNNFLRTLGETGALGFISFYGTVITSLVVAAKLFRSGNRLFSAYALGFIGATIGLLLNAVYIDVFAASKVAFTFWIATGLLLAMWQAKSNNKDYGAY